MKKRKKTAHAELIREEAEYDRQFRELLFRTVMEVKDLGVYAVIPLPKGFLQRWTEINQKLERLSDGN
jgi:hypothetical protein